MATGRRVLDDSRQTTAAELPKCQSGNKKKEFSFHLFPPAPLYQTPTNATTALHSLNSPQRPLPHLTRREPWIFSNMLTSTSTVGGHNHIHHQNLHPLLSSPSSNPLLTHGYPALNVTPFFYHGTPPPYTVGHPYPEFNVGNKRYRECMDYAHLGCRHFVPCSTSDVEPVKPAASTPTSSVDRPGKRSRVVVDTTRLNPVQGVGSLVKVEQRQEQQEEISNSHEVTSSSAESGSVQVVVNLKAQEEQNVDPVDPLELLARVTVAELDVGTESSVGLKKTGTFVHGRIPFVRKKRSCVKQCRKVSPDGCVEGNVESAATTGAIVQSKRGRNQSLPSRFENSVIGSWRKGTRKKTSS